MSNNKAQSLKSLTSKIGSGATPRGGNSTYKESGVSLIRSQNVHDFEFRFNGLAYIDEEQASILDYVSVYEHDILLNITGDSIARACIVPFNVLPARVNQHVSIIRCKSKGDAEYVLCYLQYLKNHLLSICKVGGTRNALTKQAVEKIEIVFQKNYKQIGTLITNINAKIELNNRINRELEQMARTLYDYWFVQFDFPDRNGRPYKSSGGKMVYNAELKREIPAGWEVKELGEITTVILGGTPSTEIPEYWKAGNFNWLNSGEIANFPITSSELNITESAIKNSATSLMPSGTIVISITRHIRASILAINSCANQSVVGVYETEYLKSSYLYPLILNEIPRYLSLRTGAQQPHINKNTICNTRLIIPNSNDLAEYYKITAPLYKKIINNSFENQHLSSLRDWLLPMLMNGQVTVQGAYESQKEVDGEDMSMAAEEGADYQ